MAQRVSKPKGARPRSLERRLSLWLGGSVLVLAVVMAACLPIINKYWPFRYRNVQPLLESVLASKIKIDKYHRTYFPRPGFVASGLTLTRNTAPGLAPVGTAQDLIASAIGWPSDGK